MNQVGICPITVCEAGAIVGKVMGLDWENDRKEIVDYVNKIRQKWYLSYKTYKLFDNVFHCHALCEFPLTCHDPCDDCGGTYLGFVAREDTDGAITAWENGNVMTMRSRWWEAFCGIHDKNSRRLQFIPTDHISSIERPLPTCSEIEIFSPCAENDGKKVFIEVDTIDDERKKLEFTIVGEGIAEPVEKVLVKRILPVTLPPDLEGNIILRTKTHGDNQGGYELSDYPPCSQTVPQFRRYKVTTVGCSCDTRILVKYNKKYRPVFYDHEVVEIGYSLIIEAGARYFKYGESSTEAAERDRANSDLAEMDELILGMIARKRGREYQDGNVRPTRVRKRNLYSRRK